MAFELKGLNGLRAICALVILWGHIPQTDFCQWGGVSGSFSIRWPVCCAYVFFVLSGFLAGYRCVPGMSVSAYYTKKARKILPLYYGYILASLLAFLLLGNAEEVLNIRLLYYLFLIPQVPFCMTGGIVPLVHLWFIGTVVLLYLVVPLFSRIKEESKPIAALCITVGWMLLKWGLWFFVGKDTFAYRLVSITAFDCLFLGVLLGLLWKRKSAIVVWVGENRPVAVIVWALFLLSGVYGHLVPAPVRIDYMACLGGLLILNQVSSRPILSLENKVLDWLGSISYEVYVVQILVIMLLSTLYNHAGWHWPGVVIMFVCTVVVIGVAAFVHTGGVAFRHRT